MTSDWKSAFEFYSGLFGWTKGEAMDMGPMGTYQIVERDGQMFGAMMNRSGAVGATSLALLYLRGRYHVR